MGQVGPPCSPWMSRTRGYCVLQLKEVLEPHKMKAFVHEEYILFSSVSLFAVYNRCTVNYT